jgi:hypothetical protein
MTSNVRIFRIGPIDESGMSIYVPGSTERQLDVVDARTDDEGIAKIVKQSPDAAFLCSPDLEVAAARAGLSVEPLDPISAGNRVWIAMRIAQDPDLNSVNDPWAVPMLMRGATDWVDRDVTAHWPRRLSFEAELRGDRAARYFGALLAAPMRGLVLFSSSELAKRVALLDGEEQRDLIAANDHLEVRFESPPTYASEWIKDFYGIDLMPRTMCKGNLELPSNEDLFVLGGVLSALSLMGDLNETRYAVTKSPDREVRTFISAGEPWPFVHLPESQD